MEDDEDDEEEETEIPNIQVAKPLNTWEAEGAGGTPPKGQKSTGKASARKGVPPSKESKKQKVPSAVGSLEDEEVSCSDPVIQSNIRFSRGTPTKFNQIGNFDFR